MQRRPTTQDITWILDLARNGQLDLEPPYQRRSVWTRKDKQFFLDTIFRDFPSPAVFLHKSISDDGKATYHVVDGKQRIKTIIDFANNQIRISKEYGDVRLNGKKWSDLEGEQELRRQFWNYQISVEKVDTIEGTVVKDVFDRLNRNSRKLTSQELRHAKFDGWLISFVEAESEKEEWKRLAVVTTARAKRMSDSQFLSELALVLLENSILGFDQDAIDDYYAKYDDPSETEANFSEEAFIQRFERIKAYLIEMEQHGSVITKYAKSVTHLYTLWAVVGLQLESLDAPAVVAPRYAAFMTKVDLLAEQKSLDAFLQASGAAEYEKEFAYFNASRGASTDLAPRQERYARLSQVLIQA